MVITTMLQATLLSCRGFYRWVTDFGVQRRGSNPGLQRHVTCVLLLLSLLTQACHGRRETDYLNPSSELTPLFLDTPVNVTVREGGMAILPCAVQYLGPRQVAWRRVGAKDGHFLTVGTFTWVRGNNVMVEHRQEPGYISQWNLLIKQVTQQDAGVYECQITAKDKIVRFVSLEITGPPLSEPAISVKGKKYVEKGEQIKLTCNATGGAQIPEDIDWFKDGSRIDSGSQSHVVITKYRSLEQRALISELIIDRSRMQDTGTYICRSSEKEIDSLKVTVLVADTNNVKRDKPEGTTGDEQDGEDSSSNRELRGSAHKQTALMMWTLLIYVIQYVLAT